MFDYVKVELFGCKSMPIFELKRDGPFSGPIWISIPFNMGSKSGNLSSSVKINLEINDELKKFICVRLIINYNNTRKRLFDLD